MKMNMRVQKALSSHVLLSSFLLRSNRTTLQAQVYRVFNHADWPIKRRHSHWLCSKVYLELTHFKIDSFRRLAEITKNEGTHILVQNVWFEERMNTLSSWYLRKCNTFLLCPLFFLLWYSIASLELEKLDTNTKCDNDFTESKKAQNNTTLWNDSKSIQHSKNKFITHFEMKV